ncbi:response regulator [Terriglobus aquaticus]|uniref:Response regulator n=1 Tax=Terriglobus aquaticus TaxID=940139 RepID=A0ABW9KGR4_9BACT|nr:response regulator [Terriglobus aquaticus]
MSSSKRIYLVEDDELVAETLGIILERSGYVITTYADAESAIFQVVQSAPDLVLSDVSLAGKMTGFELADEIAGSYPEVKVMLMSGAADVPGLLGKQLPPSMPYRVHAKPILPMWLLGELARVLAEVPCGGTQSEDSPGASPSHSTSSISNPSQGKKLTS